MKPPRRLLLAAVVLLAATLTGPAPAARAADPLISQGRQVTASTTENADTAASKAVDGDLTGTRWSSAFADPQWIQIDLGASATITSVVLRWEAAFARSYQIQTSDNATAWTTIYSTTTGAGGTETLTVSGTGRYVRMNGTARATGYGYSLWEFVIRTVGDGPITVPPTDPRNPDFGPNVNVFSPSTPSGDIQARLNTIFNQQHTNQFGAERYAVLFKPGTYSADVNLGFYTQVAGLGMLPDDVNLNGHVRVEADWLGNGNATQNFWRVAENLSVTLPAGVVVERWAVAQAAPYRRMHLRGAQNQIQLWNGGDGWASGGIFADTKIDGTVYSGSQQQWINRNSEVGTWNGSVWNMVFVGTAGSPPQHFPNPSHTVVDNTPTVREKPFLYFDSAGNYNVFVPALRQNSRGTSWSAGTPAGSSISLSQFFVARPSDSTALLNAALAQGRHLLFTPGVYHLSDTLRVTNPNTVVLGLGLATLMPETGLPAMTIADVDGVKVGGVLFDAGVANSPVLLQVGPNGSTASHAANPTSLHDVFFRIGGAVAGKATVSLQVNSSNVIGDHMWIWRADHGLDGTYGWGVNPAATGLVVNGADVTMYGLFVEHFQQYEVIWNGNGGRTYFFQNEKPYEVPDQASWMNGATRGYAAYKVAPGVTSHEAWGVGSYCFFNTNNSVVLERSFEVPDTAGVRFHGLVTVSLGGVGTINRVINNAGATANLANQQSYLPNYP